MKVLRRLALIIILVLLAGAGATPAFAGEYPVYACEPAHGNVNSSWVGVTGGGGTIVEVHCPTPGPSPWQQGLVARHIPGATAPRNAFAKLDFTAPPGATLSRMTYSHHFCGGVSFNAGLMNAAGTWLHNSSPVSCGTFLLSPYTLALGGTRSVSLVAMCVKDPCPGTSQSSEYAAMQAVTVWVADSTAPRLTITGGSATTPGWKRGPGRPPLPGARQHRHRLRRRHERSRRSRQAHRAQCNPSVAPRPAPIGPAGSASTRATCRTAPRRYSSERRDAANNWATATIPLNVDNTAPSAPLDLGRCRRQRMAPIQLVLAELAKPIPGRQRADRGSEVRGVPSADCTERLDRLHVRRADGRRRRGARRRCPCRGRGSGPSECGCAMRPATRAGTRRKRSR